jgi:hypothetical protein
MFCPKAIQWYRFQADHIWPDGPINVHTVVVEIAIVCWP